jgi:hypothetical protein
MPRSGSYVYVASRSMADCTPDMAQQQSGAICVQSMMTHEGAAKYCGWETLIHDLPLHLCDEPKLLWLVLASTAAACSHAQGLKPTSRSTKRLNVRAATSCA